MFHAFYGLQEVPHEANHFASVFLPFLDPYELAVLALGFFTSLLVNLKLRHRVKQQAKQVDGPLVSIRYLMDRVILILTYLDMIGSLVPFVCILLRWKYYKYQVPQIHLVGAMNDTRPSSI